MGVKKIIKRFIPKRLLTWRRGRNQAKIMERAKKRMQEVMESEPTYGLNTTVRDQKIIVSLTSYPARFAGAYYAIRSIFAQSVKADRIILYVDDNVTSEQYPAELAELQKYGLEIISRPLNLKPHKKYFYAMKENPEDIVITVDDDQIYPSDLFEKLLACYKKFPKCVIAARAHRIGFSDDGEIKPYNEWKMESEKVYKPSFALCATGVGGVLYPPHCMYKDLFQYDLISKLAPNADDLWLKVMQILQGTSVVICSKTLWRNTYEVLGSQTTALKYENVDQSQNDKQMRNLIDHYRLTKRNFLN